MRASELRKLAWGDLGTGQYWPFVGGFFVLQLILGALCIAGIFLAAFAFGVSVAMAGSFDAMGSMLSEWAQNPMSVAENPLPILAFLIGTLVASVPLLYATGYGGWGMARMALAASNREFRFEQCLSGWGRGWRMCWTILVQVTYVQLWLLLFIVPGIVKCFSYAMTAFVQVEHPAWSASQCITESRRLMDGNKWRYLCLNVSFFGWYALAFAIALIPFCNFFSGLAQYFLAPYVMTAQAEFYKTVKREKLQEIQ